MPVIEPVSPGSDESGKQCRKKNHNEKSDLWSQIAEVAFADKAVNARPDHGGDQYEYAYRCHDGEAAFAACDFFLFSHGKHLSGDSAAGGLRGASLFIRIQTSK
jgi:hypothetical protein